MKLTAFTDVCLRVLATLAHGAGDGDGDGGAGRPRLTSHELAEHVAVPYNHVVKAVAELRRRGLLEVARGRTGGATITDAGLALPVGSLVRELSPRTDVVDCEGLESGRPCPLLGGCRLRSALARAREAFLSELDDVRVRDLAGSAPAGAPGGPVALGLPGIAPSPLIQ